MSEKTRKVVFTAVFAALTTVFTLISIPLATGYYNFGDIAIYIASILLGPICGAIAGGLGGALGDLALGYIPYMPFTLAIKAFEGIIVGLLFKFVKKFTLKKHSDAVEAILATLINTVAGLAMAGGYFLAEGLLLSEGKWSGGLVNLPFNVLQGFISAILASVILYAFKLKALFYKMDKSRFNSPVHGESRDCTKKRISENTDSKAADIEKRNDCGEENDHE